MRNRTTGIEAAGGEGVQRDKSAVLESIDTRSEELVVPSALAVVPLAWVRLS